MEPDPEAEAVAMLAVQAAERVCGMLSTKEMCEGTYTMYWVRTKRTLY